MVFLKNFDEKEPIIVEGVWEGYVVTNPCGKNGFGYDPIFEYEDRTLAELSLDEKTNISHRNIASIKMVELLNEKI